MSKSLVIVESPAKAKTIEKILGKDFTVKSSIGHIRDLPKSGMSIDINNGFTPQYEINKDKKSTVNELKKLSKEADIVWLATDEDREGEAIAWHLFEALKLDEKKTKRIVFHEITPGAIKSAIQNPRSIDKKLVDAQQARRVLDRLVGYELSPVLWKKVRYGLSAGRVQSVAVRLIAEREREILDFNSESFFKVNANLFSSLNKPFNALLSDKLENNEQTLEFLNEVKASVLKVKDVTKRPGTRKPAPPFTTSTLQQEANRKFGYSTKQTMSIAQRLYENGKITYMRTDSLNLSETAIENAKQVINQNFGSEYLHTRKYSTKSAGAQEAHEAIRPTDFNTTDVEGMDYQAQKLYELIWKRTLASQMSDAKLERTTVNIAVSESKRQLQAKGEVIKFDGFLKLYLEGKDEEDEDEDNGLLPDLKEEEIVTLEQMTARESFTKAQARYSEASLVKKLEELGIGRPSTYAPTISTIQDRSYVIKEDRPGAEREYKLIILKNDNIEEKVETEISGAEKAKLFPTDTGLVVNDFLVEYFPEIVDLHFTAKVEEEFDEISNGNKVWNEMISDFYIPFHKSIENSDSITKAQAIKPRELGIDPKTQKKVYARIGRFGAMVQLGDQEEDEELKFASIPKTSSLDTITFEEALKLFQLPRILGENEEGPIKANLGRFGPYVQLGKTFASLKNIDVYEVTLEEALTLIEEKREAERNKMILNFEEEGIQVLNGRYGPYITDGKTNAKIPKDKEPKSLTLEECKKLIAEAPAKKGRRAPAKKSTAKATTKKTTTKKTTNTATKKPTKKK